MANLITTYRHDYTTPNLQRLGVKSVLRAGHGPVVGDICCRECEPTTSALHEGLCKGGEWTRRGPMGPLISPRIIPEPPTEAEVNQCFKDRPNRFLNNLCVQYPELYEKLKGVPKDEMFRKVEVDRMLSTYQIDFDRLREYPVGAYDDVTSKVVHPNGEDRDHPGSCGYGCRALLGDKCRKKGYEEDEQDDPCRGLYRPVRKIGITGMPRGYVQSSHWPPLFKKEALASEYQDVISRIGKSIIAHKIHDHSKCTRESNCIHAMKLKKNSKKKCICLGGIF